MRVKKLLALLLSGAFFAGCLSGCDRTVIEHQFHTNTEHVTGEETSSPEIGGNLDALINVLLLNGIMDLYMQMYSSVYEIGDMNDLVSKWENFGLENASDLAADVNDEILNNFVSKKTEGIILRQEYGAESEYDSFTSACSKLLGILSEKLRLFTQEDWVDEEDKYMVVVYNIKNLNKTYAVVMLGRSI